MATRKDRVARLEAFLQREDVQLLLARLVAPADRGGTSPRDGDALDARLQKLDRVLRSRSLRQLAALPGVEAAGGELAGLLAEIVKWLLEEKAFVDAERRKAADRDDEWSVREGESEAHAPEVAGEIVAVRCARPGWLEIEVALTGTAGAGGDDVTRLKLRLPSPDCNGTEWKGDHVFEDEEEVQRHVFAFRVRCASLVWRSREPADASLWVEAKVYDDEGRVRTSFLKLSSPELSETAAECCRRQGGD